MSLPSMTRSEGTSAPASFAKVGRRSMAVISSGFSFPAGILPGQRMTVGSRMPPSKVLPLRPLSGPAVPMAGPLSEKNITRVFSSMSCFASVSRIRPTESSISRIAWRNSLSRVG